MERQFTFGAMVRLLPKNLSVSDAETLRESWVCYSYDRHTETETCYCSSADTCSDLSLLLVAIAIPNFVKARSTSGRDSCVSNLRQIDGAKDQWAIENKVAKGGTPDTNAVCEYIKGNHLPTCRAGGTYSLNPIGKNPTCRIGGSGHSLPLP